MRLIAVLTPGGPAIPTFHNPQPAPKAVGGAQMPAADELPAELGPLARRQADLEEVELEILERQESVERALAESRRLAADVEEQLTAATGRRDQAFADIDKDSAYVTEGRAETRCSASGRGRRS